VFAGQLREAAVRILDFVQEPQAVRLGFGVFCAGGVEGLDRRTRQIRFARVFLVLPRPAAVAVLLADQPFRGTVDGRLDRRFMDEAE
jgi:hypothetical protein